jgi:hypothetical protein
MQFIRIYLQFLHFIPLTAFEANYRQRNGTNDDSDDDNCSHNQLYVVVKWPIAGIVWQIFNRERFCEIKFNFAFNKNLI